MGNDTRGETETEGRIFDSTLESVDRVEALATEYAQRLGFDEDDLHKIAMAVRECMVNAVAHGNRYSAHKKVRVTMSKDARQFMIVIADQGEGFDPERVADPLADENLLRNSGRGMFLIRAFMDEVRVRSLEPSGTEVRLVKNLVSK
jgi:serine/threonine-protein kinase RsbW